MIIDFTANILSYFIEHAPKTITRDELIDYHAYTDVTVSKALLKLKEIGLIFEIENGYRTLTMLETIICRDMRLNPHWYIPSDFDNYCDDIQEIKDSLKRLKSYGVVTEIMGSYRIVAAAAQYTKPYEELRSIPKQVKLI